MLTPYTTNDQVRAVLGVSDEELPDATLDLPIYEANLRQELVVVGASVGADFKTVSAQATFTDVEQAFLDMVTLFAPTAVGLHLAQSLPLFVAKQVTDGKAAVTRHTDSPFQGAIDACRKNYERFRQALERTYAAYKNTIAPDNISTPIVFIGAQPSSDPVTGT